jgi:hypothetical protein
MVVSIRSTKTLSAPRADSGRGVPMLAVDGYTSRWSPRMLSQPNGSPITSLAALVGASPLAATGPLTLKSPASNMRSMGGAAGVRAAATVPVLQQPYTVVTVAKINTAGAAVILGSQAPGLAAGNNDSLMRIGSTATTYEMDTNVAGAQAVLVHTKPVDTSHHVFICVFDGVNSVFSIDGVEVVGNAGLGGLYASLNLFTYPTNGGVWPGESAELAIYPRRLDSAERFRLATQLAPLAPFNVVA